LQTFSTTKPPDVGGVFVFGLNLMPELSFRSLGMNKPQQFNSIHLQNALARKLHPSRFPRMSTVMAAIVGFIVDQRFTDPSIIDIIVANNGVVVVRTDAEVNANHIIGTYTDVVRNWAALLAAAELTSAEVIEAQSLFAAKIGFLWEASA
jgi:hypothetical protein